MIKVDKLEIRGAQIAYHPNMTRTSLHFIITGELEVAQWRGKPVVVVMNTDTGIKRCNATYSLESHNWKVIPPFEAGSQRELVREALLHYLKQIPNEQWLLNEANYASACYHFDQSRELMRRSNQEMETSRQLWLGAKSNEPMFVVSFETEEERKHKEWLRNFSVRDFLRGL